MKKFDMDSPFVFEREVNNLGYIELLRAEIL